MSQKRDTIEVTLSRWEALVLFEWLASLDAGKGSIQLDEAEQKVVWRLEGQLESMLTAVVAADYRDQLATAKQKVLDDSE